MQDARVADNAPDSYLNFLSNTHATHANANHPRNQSNFHRAWLFCFFGGQRSPRGGLHFPKHHKSYQAEPSAQKGADTSLFVQVGYVWHAVGLAHGVLGTQFDSKAFSGHGAALDLGETALLRKDFGQTPDPSHEPLGFCSTGYARRLCPVIDRFRTANTATAPRLHSMG